MVIPCCQLTNHTCLDILDSLQMSGVKVKIKHMIKRKIVNPFTNKGIALTHTRNLDKTKMICVNNCSYMYALKVCICHYTIHQTAIISRPLPYFRYFRSTFTLHILTPRPRFQITLLKNLLKRYLL